MQVPSQGQWWSSFKKQELHTEQCDALGGLIILPYFDISVSKIHVMQYLT